MYVCGTHKVGWRLCFDYLNLKNLKKFAIKVCDGEGDGLSNLNADVVHSTKVTEMLTYIKW